MRIVSYVRTEFHGDDENVENTLLAFIYDIPYIGACGIFPPLHILNQIFEGGGGDGGMSPGAIWDPFSITKEEYDALAIAISSTVPEMLTAESRYNHIQFEFDAEFDNIQDWADWMGAVCSKHRETYRQKIEQHKKST